ncbi:hypothetical protein SNE510_58080 [Streptomyces sp. NE5-10]|nr:hypothetical protein SNE510_58080 [Streptomyces sp. NE5-10]
MVTCSGCSTQGWGTSPSDPTTSGCGGSPGTRPHLPRPPPAQVRLQVVAARAVRGEGTPERLERVAAVQSDGKVRNIPPVQLRQADHRQRIHVRGPRDPVLQAQFGQQLSFLRRGPRVLSRAHAAAGVRR